MFATHFVRAPRGLTVTFASLLGLTWFLSGRAGAHEELLADRASIDHNLTFSQHPAALCLERASLNRQLGDWDSALRDLDRARGFGAESADVDRGRAEVLMAKGDVAAAERAASAALRAMPGDEAARTIRARARMSQGLFQLAADDFGQAITVAPRRPLDLVCARAEALGQIPEDGGRRAIAVLDAEIERRGNLPSLHLSALEHERALGDHAATLARIDALRSAGWSEARCGLATGDVCLAMHADSALGRRSARAAWQSALAAMDRMPTRRRTTRAAIRLRTEIERRLQEVK